MTLRPVPLPPDQELASRPPPADVVRLIEDAQTRAYAFAERGGEHLVTAFVQSDLRRAWEVLGWIRERGLASGRTFCEWGSGIGAVALLAAYAGFRAYGIEVEDLLVQEAEDLARTHGLEAEFACGSFLPEGADVSPQDLGDFAWLDCSAGAAYDELALDPDEFDVVYAFPWPGEHYVIHELFDDYASPGALLLTWLGVEGARLHRKV